MIHKGFEMRKSFVAFFSSSKDASFKITSFDIGHLPGMLRPTSGILHLPPHLLGSCQDGIHVPPSQVNSAEGGKCMAFKC